MQTSRFTVSSFILGTSLLLGSVSPIALAQEKSISVLSPTGGWSVAKMGSGAEGYCALSRQYSQGLVLTLGRNAAEEYSLAIDFQSANLNPDKAYSMTLQPGPGQIRAYEMMPASAQAMVVRLGYDESFFQSLEQSQELKAEVDGKHYNFALSDFAAGQKDLTSCMSGLKGGESSPTKVAKGFSAQKVQNAPPMPETVEAVPPPPNIEIAAAPQQATPIREKTTEKTAETVPAVPAPTVEPAVTPVVTSAIEKQKPIIPPAVKEATKTIVPKVEPQPEIKVADLPVKKDDLPKLATPVAPTKVEAPVKAVEAPAEIKVPKMEQAKMVAPTPVPETDKIVSVAPDIKRNTPTISTANREPRVSKAIEISKVGSKQGKKSFAKAPVPELKTQPQAMAAVKAPDVVQEVVAPKEVVRDMPKPVQVAKAPEQAVSETQKQYRQEVDQLKAENERLAKALQAQASKPTPAEPEVVAPKEPDPALVKQVSTLKAENERLASALQGQQDKVASFDAASPNAEQELEEMRKRMKQLEEENKKFYEEAREAQRNIDRVKVDVGNVALEKISNYEKKLEAAQADNLELSKEIEEMRRMQEDGRLGAVSGDWDLEQATKRYNEAEREIKRLGMLLEQQRTAHRQEKVELEDMLFDPAVTDQEQRRRLGELETQLATAEQQLRQAGIRPNVAPRVGITPTEERIGISSVPPAVPAAPVVAQQLDNLEMQRLNNKINRQNQQLQAYARQQSAQQPSPNVPRAPAAVSQVAAQPLVPPQQVLPQQPKPKPVAVVTSTNFGQSQLQDLLMRSGVTLKGTVAKVADNQYRWSSGSLTGAAQVVPAKQAGSLEQFAQNYIGKIKQSCGGDFASVPTNNSGSIQSYEVACISASRSQSSSIVFTQQGGDYVAIAHETSADDMDVAMDARDRIVTNL